MKDIDMLLGKEGGKGEDFSFSIFEKEEEDFGCDVI